MPRAVVQGDCNLRNLLFDGDKLVAMIDWDECHVDLLAWEVAQAGYGSWGDLDEFWSVCFDAGGPLETLRRVASGLGSLRAAQDRR